MGGSGKMAGNGEWNVEGKMEMRAVRRSGRQRRDDSGEEPWPGQGVAAVAAAAAVGLLPQPSLSSHLRGRSLLSFFK